MVLKLATWFVLQNKNFHTLEMVSRETGDPQSFETDYRIQWQIPTPSAYKKTKLAYKLSASIQEGE